MKKNIKAIIITFVILIIPFFYVLFFLKAFFDPYSNMKNIPVAIVNLDEGNLGESIIEKLKEKNVMDMKILSSDEKAEQGVKKRLYYSSITIPKNFSRDLENLTKTEIIFRTNKKYNFIASQIYEKVASELMHTVKENVSVEVLNKLNSGISDTAIKISTLNDGLEKIDDGSSKLLEGVKTLNTKYDEFNNGISNLNNGIDKLNSGSKEYINGVNKAIKGLDDISGGVIELGDKLAVLKLSKKFNKLYNGAKLVKEKNIRNELTNAGRKIEEGLNNLNSGSVKLKNASGNVKAALSQIENGSSKLNSGIKLAHKAVDSSTKASSAKLKKLEKLNDFVNNSVSLNTVNIDNVDNYGTVFAAYFMSISLWVGAIVIVVVMFYDPKDRFGIFDRTYENKNKQYILYLGLVILQALMLSKLITIPFDFTKLNFLVLIISMLITDLAFFSMVYCFITLFDDIGKFLSIILLIIQISASAGTFPIETAPKLFMDVFPFIPMKYSVNLFKEAFGGYDKEFFYPNFIVLLKIFIAFSVITMVFNYIKKKISEKK